ncbi:MAG: putative membrane protein YfcA [Paracoccaceae bacterium]|jgi:uncharacterized membrane protein YfcA
MAGAALDAGAGKAQEIAIPPPFAKVSSSVTDTLIETLPLLLFLMVVGAGAGVLAGLLGVGGGIVLVPAFYHLFSGMGYEPPQLMQICVATSLATIMFTSLRSMAGHRKKGAVDDHVLISWGPGIVIGAFVGMFAASSLKSDALMAIFGVMGCGVGMWMALGKAHWRLGSEMPKGVARAILSPLLGFFSVLMGIGGGSLGTPIMTLYNMPIHRAVGTAAGFGLLIAAPAVLGFLANGWSIEGKPPYTVGLVNIPAFLVIIAMTFITAPLGVRLAHSLDAKILRRTFALFISVIALRMLAKALGLI